MYKFGTVYAYLSPTNASLMLQLLLGGFAAFSIILKVFWARFKDARRRDSQ